MENKCLFCGEKLRGRADKKFCDSGCRNSYNNQKYTVVSNTVRNISNRLKKNRRILMEILPEEETTKKTNRDYLNKKGFDFQYFTHIYTTKKGKIYHYVFDMGYLDLGDDWFLIVRKND